METRPAHRAPSRKSLLDHDGVVLRGALGERQLVDRAGDGAEGGEVLFWACWGRYDGVGFLERGCKSGLFERGEFGAVGC